MDTQTSSGTASQDVVVAAISASAGVAQGPETAIERASVEAAGATAGKHGLMSPWRVANFRRLFTGQLISRLGDNFYYVALPWLILRATSSAQAPLALTFVLASYSVAMGIFTLAGGVLADRIGPRTLMLITDAWRLITVTALGVLTLTTTPPLWLIAALAASLGIGSGLFYPASVAMIPHLVPEDDLQAANSFDQLGMQLSNLLGPSGAGFILAATRLALGFVIDAVTFAVSLLTLSAIRMPARSVEARGKHATDDASKSAGGLREVVRFLREMPFIVQLVIISLVLNFAVNGLIDVALPLFLKQQVGVSAGPRAFGIIIGGFGLGSVIGAIVAGLASKLRRKILVAVLTLFPTGVLIGLVPLVANQYAIAGLFCGAGLSNAIGNVLFITVVQKLVPLRMMGRMMSVLMLGSFIGTPLSLVAYGFAATIVPSVGALFVIGSSLFVVMAVVALFNKRTWQIQ